MKVLLRQHGLNLSGVKSDLYTMIGRVCFPSMHASPINFDCEVWTANILVAYLQL